MDETVENRHLAAKLREAAEGRADRGYERTILYEDEEGIERETVVIDLRAPSRLRGREAIVELLRDGGH